MDGENDLLLNLRVFEGDLIEHRCGSDSQDKASKDLFLLRCGLAINSTNRLDWSLDSQIFYHNCRC